MPGDLVILHTNDFHGRLTAARAAFLRDLPRDLYFDCGDSVKSGNLGVPLKPEACWPLLREAGCDASILGNRESHPVESAFRAKLDGLSHTVVCANLRTKSGALVFPESLVMERQGVRVGVIGAMVAIVTERMMTKVASAYLWDPPIEAAMAAAQRLRPEVDLLIALTHIGFAQDKKLAEACPEIDLILGGHSHTVIEQPQRFGNAWVCQTGSHGRFVGRYVWRDGLAEGGLLPLP